MSIFCSIDSLNNESDVEQKFLFPLLNKEHPLGLGYSCLDIQTKQKLKALKIGKSNAKTYFPDYVITIRGLPAIVIEAKAPSISLDDAYHEARLYAAEINAKTSHNVSPCKYLLVSNGKTTLFGYTDTDTPTLELCFEDFLLQGVKFEELKSYCSKKVIEDYIESIYNKISENVHYVYPISEIGGKRIANSELEENPYGRTLVLENQSIFDPKTEYDRMNIVENAYIESKKREQHIEPLYRQIKKMHFPSNINSVAIGTDNPSEIIDKLGRSVLNNESAYSLMLLIGNVGSGKTTFIRYFKHVILKNIYPDIYGVSEWLFIDLNNAPINKNEIYSWLNNRLEESIKDQLSDVHFDNIETIKNIYREEISKFELGLGQLLKDDTSTYKVELFKHLRTLMDNKTEYIKLIFKYMVNSLHLIPIIVLDNCDKRDRDSQLLMFEVAEWLRSVYKTIILLPMRDSTFDMYKDEPPLDTVVKDLVFRIDPPDLLKVLQARVDYIIRNQSNAPTSYHAGTQYSVTISADEQFDYIRSIIMSIRKDDWAKRIFYNLSNRSIRKGLQIFVDFCKSGHIESSEFLKLRLDTRDYNIPSYKLLTALIRKNRKYFDDRSSNFTNLFYSTRDDNFPDPFIRLDILFWLKDNFHQKGSNGLKGFHQIKTIVNAMLLLGHNEKGTIRELNELIHRGLIFSESQNIEYNSDDLVKLNTSGFLHVDLLKNITYISAVSENIIYRDTVTLTNIARRLKRDNHLDKLNLVLNAIDMIEYLRKYRNMFFTDASVYLDTDNNIPVYDFKETIDSINRFIDNDGNLSTKIALIRKYKPRSEVTCRIIAKKKHSLVCRIDKEIKGFLATTDSVFNLTPDTYTNLVEDSFIKCEIIDYDSVHSSFQLKFKESL